MGSNKIRLFAVTLPTICGLLTFGAFYHVGRSQTTMVRICCLNVSMVRDLYVLSARGVGLLGFLYSMVRDFCLLDQLDRLL